MHAKLEWFNKINFSKLVLQKGLPNWINFHETILKNYKFPIHIVQYEKLKKNLIGEMRRILSFLEFDFTKEIESCLHSDFDGKFKR